MLLALGSDSGALVSTYKCTRQHSVEDYILSSQCDGILQVLLLYREDYLILGCVSVCRACTIQDVSPWPNFFGGGGG
jgi:hypothetical protein